MSTDPSSRPPRLSRLSFFAGGLGIIALFCVILIVVVLISGSLRTPELGGLFIVMGCFLVLDVVALLGLGIWFVHSSVPGTAQSVGRTAGKLVLALGLGLATIIFLFATCFAIIN